MSEESNSKRMVRNFVERVKVRSLFGRYSYSIDFRRQDDRPNLATGILYGDNGCGKTTILSLLYHTLSAKHDGSDLEKIGAIPFTYFGVSLSNRIIVGVRRSNATMGDFSLFMERPQEADIEAEATFSADQKLEATSELDILLKLIRSLDFSLVFITHEREVLGNIDYLSTSVRSRASGFLSEPVRRSRLQEALETAISITERAIRDQFIDKVNWGLSSSVSSYVEILESMIAIKAQQHDSEGGLGIALESRLRSLEDRSRRLKSFGLHQPIDVSMISKRLAEAPSASRKFMLQVVESYVKTEESRFSELELIAEWMDTFASLINGMFIDKRVTLTLGSGLVIETEDGQRLKPTALSSGEKHLLLLFCAIVSSYEKPTIFMIDEPEISLNVKWQRKLLEGLLRLLRSSGCQVIIATHSIEMIASRREFVNKLEAHRDGDEHESRPQNS